MNTLSRMTPGALFLMFFASTIASSPEVFLKISEVGSTILDTLRTQQVPVLISINFLFLAFLVYLIATLGFIIEKIWDFFFYFFLKGYNRKEYELIKKTLLSKLPDVSAFRSEIEKMNIQPIYGLFLHSYAKQTWVEWLGRRWDTFHASASYTIGIITAITTGIILIYSNAFTFTIITYSIIFLGFIISFFLIYVGNLRRKELLTSEYLFCISVANSDVASGFEDICEIITCREKNIDKSEKSNLDKRL